MAKKKVKKFQAGGDARRVMSPGLGAGGSGAASMSISPRNPFNPRGKHGDGGASGAVGDVLTAGREAQDFLGTAGEALGASQGNVGILGQPPFAGGAGTYKKGGKVAKKKKSSGGKPRGVGLAKKGVRPVKMVKMKG
jgi:hypothetical protein|tara:strand:- start:165 stop:575 length:411 start_codon:yes stop_codon:yes gene_type:complete